MGIVKVYLYEANRQTPSSDSGVGAAKACDAITAAIDSGRFFASVSKLFSASDDEQLVWVLDRTVFVRFRRSRLETPPGVIDGFAAASLDEPTVNERQEMVLYPVDEPAEGLDEAALFSMALAYGQALAFERAAADVMGLELSSSRSGQVDASWAETLENMMLWNSRVLWWESIGPDQELASLYRSVQEHFSSRALHDQSLSEIRLIQAQASDRRAEATNDKLNRITMRLTWVGVVIALLGLLFAGVQIWQAVE